MTPIKINTARVEHNHVIIIQILVVLLGAPFFLLIDSPWLTPYYSYGQDVANIIMACVYSSFLLGASRKLYWLILLMTISSLFAEGIGSFVLALYQYRLKNIPLYIPLGHAVIYATVYHVCKQPLVWRYHLAIEKCLGKFAFITAFMSLFILKDIAGFLCYLIFLMTVRYRKKTIFYLSMFVMVYYIEVFGTVFSTWAWYVVLDNHPQFPTIASTPSGIAGLYILIDLVSNSIYFYIIKIRRYLRKRVPQLITKSLNTSIISI